MKRPRAGCPGGALAASGGIALRINPQAVRWPRHQLKGLPMSIAFDFDRRGDLVAAAAPGATTNHGSRGIQLDEAVPVRAHGSNAKAIEEAGGSLGRGTPVFRSQESGVRSQRWTGAIFIR